MKGRRGLLRPANVVVRVVRGVRIVRVVLSVQNVREANRWAAAASRSEATAGRSAGAAIQLTVATPHRSIDRDASATALQQKTPARRAEEPWVRFAWQDPAMTIIRFASAVMVVLAMAVPAAGQSILFENTISNALRQRPANRQCPGCEERPGAVHLIGDSPLLTD